MNFRDCYKILGVSEGASLDEVKSAYRRRAFELHPDLHPDNPNAAKDFQQLNEAYVLLTKESEDYAGGAKARARGAAGRSNAKDTEDTRQKAKKAYEKAKKGFSKAQEKQASKQKTSSSSHASSSSGGRAQSRAAGNASQTSAGGYQKEEVLNDILKDPFARRVFEDIYSQIRRDGGKSVPAPKKKRKLSFEWGDSKTTFDLTHGVSAGMKGWFKRQMDDEQTIYLPPQNLLPGARVRITIAQGMSNEKKQIEVTLPPDFVVGRPIRLKGLGRKIGPWRGDLFLRILAKV